MNLSKKLIILIVAFFSLCTSSYSQKDQIQIKEHQVKKSAIGKANIADFGVGFGLDYGGMGFQLGFTAAKRLTFFAAGGFYGISAGWNVGIKTLLVEKTTAHAFRPFLKAMYGSHSRIVIDGTDEYNKVYNGFTVGAGAEIRLGKKKVNGFDLDLNIPLRTPEFWEDYQNISNRPDIQIKTGPKTLAFSIGFHHEF